MRKLQRFTALASCLGLAVACSSSPEPPKQNPGLMGPDAKAGYDKDAEEQRLRDMMAVRVIDDQGNVEEWSASDVLNKLGETCASEHPECAPIPNGCAGYECLAVHMLCLSERTLATVRGGAEPTFTSGTKTYRIPPQSAATKAAMTEASVGLTTLLSLALAANIPSTECPATPSGGEDLGDARALGPGSYGEFLAGALVENYFLGKEAWELNAQNSLAVADNQVGTAALRAVGLTRSYAGESLSRASAAHAFVGGAPMFQGDAKPICTAQSLTPQGQAALSVLRESGLAPDALLGFEPYASRYSVPTIDTATLLNSPSVPQGCVKQRLEYFLGAGLQGTVQEHYDVSLQAFDEARRWMAEEVVALSRSRTAVLASDVVAPTYAKYAATATPAPNRPAAYYGALARTDALDAQGKPALNQGVWRAPFVLDTNGTWVNPLRSPSPDLATNFSYSTFVRANLGIVETLKANPALQAAPNFNAIAGVLSTVTAAHDSLGLVTLCESGSSRTITAAGFTPTDQLVVVRGEDALACATAGSIEGAPCTTADIPQFPIQTTGAAPAGYSVAVASAATSFFDVPARYYLLRPRSAGDTVGVGNASALVGFVPYQFGAGSDGCIEVPIIPLAEEATKAALEPSPTSCARPRTDCAGGSFDDRLPLEDELSSDGDNIESSWKHYLALAKSAAAESDRLGDEYVNTVVGSLSRDEEEDLRRIAREDRVAAELDALQEICGTAIDPSSLFAALGMNSEGQLDAGASVSDWETRLNSGDPEMQRLAECLNDFGNVTYATLGDEPLCAWSTPNGFCADAPDNEPCPQAGTNCTAPPNANELIQVGAGDYLNFFDTSKTLPPPPPETVCTSLRRLREGSSEDFDADLESVRDSFIFQPQAIKTVAKTISTELDPGGYETVHAGGLTFSTGSTVGGVNTFSWPCAPSGASGCEGPDTSLFCAPLSCGNPLDKAVADNRLYMAAIAALTLGGADSTVEMPAYHRLGLDLGSEQNRAALDPNTGNTFLYQERSNNEWRVVEFSSAPPGYPIATFLGNTDDPFMIVPGQGTDDAYAGNGVDPIPFLPYATGELFDGTQWPFNGFGFFRMPVDTTGLLPTNLFSGLATYDGGVEGPLLAMLRGKPVNSDRAWFDSYVRNPTTHGVAGIGEDRTNALYFGDPRIDKSATHATPRVRVDPRYDREAILDGMELLCAASTGGVTGRACTSENAPELHSLNDLDRLGEHIQCMGDGITRAAVYTIFQNVPRAALKPIIEQQGIAGGAYGEAISALRTALLDISTSGPTIGRELRLFGQDLIQLKHTMKSFDLKDQMSEVKLAAETADQLASCLRSLVTGLPTPASPDMGSYAGAQITCANSVAQVNFSKELQKLGTEDNEAQRQIAIADFNKRFTDHVTALEIEDAKLKAALESVGRQLLVIENLKQRGKRTLSKAIWYATQQSEATIPLSTTYDRRRATARERYESAHQNAKRLAFLARRAVEQRIGVSLESMTNDLPLVDAPARWADGICATSGIDYATLTGDDGNTRTSFADSYIGAYVTKLENVVESYRLENSFHEGSDTTLLSLRDDIYKTKSACKVDSVNLLTHPLGFDRPRSELDPETPTWHVEGCVWHDVYDINGNVAGRASDDCLDVVESPDLDGDGQPDFLSPFTASLGELGTVQGKTLRFGGASHCQEGDTDCGYQSEARLVQTLELTPGQYRFSIYARNDLGLGTSQLQDLLSLSFEPGLVEELDRNSAPTESSEWSRVYVLFQVNQTTTVEVGIGSSIAGSRPANEIVIAAPQLDQPQKHLSEADYNLIEAKPATFEAPDENGQITRLTCPDSGGSTFREVSWDYGCVKLCPNGYASSCLENAKNHCYWETSFQLSQRAWENGEVFGQGGFARGNFNYRIEDVGVNFVGQNLRDCSNSDSPDACYSNAYLPFSLYHVGPFYVRNYEGNDFEALLFDGKIEHARGLAAGRYLGNPLSSGDQQLLTPYIRQEFRGRPLDGMFRIRIWDEEGVDFKKLEDVQLMINYRYWTRNN